MKKLPLKTKKHSYDFEQVERSERVAIYSKSEKGKHYIYEVFEIKSHNGYTLGNRYIEPAEAFPSNEQFGTIAWTYPSLERAKAKAKEIELNIIEREKRKLAQLEAV